MSVLVTGASGMLGEAVARTLGDRALALAGRAAGDLAEPNALDTAARGREVKGIIHCAAFTSVDQAERQPDEAYRSNVLATRSIARWAASHAAPLVYVSTASVFDGERGGYRPGDVPRPLNYYSWTKLLGEESVLQAGGRVVRLTVIGVRAGRRPPANFLEWLSVSLATPKAVTLFEDAKLNPLSPGTAAEVLSSVLAKAPPGSLWHAGSRDVASKADIGRYWQRRHYPGAESYVSIARLDAGPGAAARGRELWLDVRDIEAIHPMPAVEAELDRCSRENPPWT
jgi:dTDP-4-dehydrorhamnose reductase